MKSIFRSKTLYLAIVTGVIGVVQAVPSEALNPHTAGILTAVLGVLVFINRFYTTKPIAITAPAGEMGNL